MKRIYVGLLLAQLNVASAFELTQLEQWLTTAPTLQPTQALVAERQARLERYQAESGWEVFGSVGTGWQREAVDADRSRSYGSLSERLGLSYPLLGARQSQQRREREAVSALEQSRLELESERRQNLLLLRAAYGDYWRAQSRYRLAEQYLQRETQVQQLLNDRQQQGLLLPSDRMEFASGFDLVRRDAARARLDQQRARDQLELLTAQALPDAEVSALNWPAIPASPNLEPLEQDLLLQQTEQQRQLALEQRQQSDWAGVDVRVSVGQGLSQQFPGEPGANTGVQLDLRMPLSWNQQRRSLSAEYQAQAAQAQAKAQQRRQQLQDRQAELVRRQDYAQANLDFAEKRQLAASQAMSERQLRLLYLDSDVLEQSIKSQLAFYHAQADWFDAVHELYGTRLDYWALINQWPQPQSQPVPDWSLSLGQSQQALTRHFESGTSRPAECLGVYLWHSRALLADPGPRSAFWSKLGQTRICRVLLSLDAGQINTPVQTGRQLTQFLQQARQHRVKIDWLLGEPSWIQAKHRPELLALLRQFQAVDFDAVHLDLEPEQLQGEPSAELLQQWLTTIEQVTRQSRWPVGLSLHPRHLEHSGTVGSPCIGCRLQALPLADVSLMIYQRPASRVLERTRQIRQRFPGLCLAVAQSVEPSLSTAESYAGWRQAQMVDQALQLHKGLASANFCGLLLQSWEDFKEMQP